MSQGMIFPVKKLTSCGKKQKWKFFETLENAEEKLKNGEKEFEKKIHSLTGFVELMKVYKKGS